MMSFDKTNPQAI